MLKPITYKRIYPILPGSGDPSTSYGDRRPLAITECMSFPSSLAIHRTSCHHPSEIKKILTPHKALTAIRHQLKLLPQQVQREGTQMCSTLSFRKLSGLPSMGQWLA